MACLIITEKPKVAEKVAYALADGAVGKKSAHGVSYYSFSRAGEEFFVAPAVGHLYTLRQTVKGSGYPVFDIEWAPSSEVDKDAAFTKKYVSQLSSLAKKADSFIVACDYDIEGSLIGFNVIKYACKSQSGKRMKPGCHSCRRLWCGPGGRSSTRASSRSFRCAYRRRIWAG